MTARCPFLAPALAVALATTTALGTVTVIQPPPGHTFNSWAVSRNGAYVATTTTVPNNTPQLHRLDLSTGVSTTIYTGGPGPLVLASNGISGDGGTAAFSGAGRAMRWRNGTAITLRASSIGTPQPTHMSADGNIIYGYDGDGGSRPVWRSLFGEPAQLLDPGTPSSTSTLGPACSANGSLAVWTTDLGGAFWNGSVITNINVNVRWAAISGNGSLLAGLDTSNQLITWVRTTDIATRRLQGLVTGGSIGASVKGISTDGALIYGTSGSGSGSQGAWVWSQSTGLISLLSYAQGRGVNVSGWSFISQASMSDDGRIFVGTGTYQGVANTVFVMQIPSPASLAIFLFMATPRRRRQ